MDVTSAMTGIQLIPPYPFINESVMLSITDFKYTVLGVAWYKGPRAEHEYQILVYFPENSFSFPGPMYNEGSFTHFANGSLLIKDLQITDEGTYIVNILYSGNENESLNVTLTLNGPVTKPMITASTTQPKENDPFTLTCVISRAVLITWTRRGTRFSSKMKLTGDNKTLTFSKVKREDSGEYQCEAQDSYHKELSDPYSVNVAYGPDKANIEGTLFVRPGYPITLSCSADSFPPTDYQWKVNDKISEEKTNKYSISNAVTEDQGIYTCVVRNLVTLRNATASEYVNITAESIIPISNSSSLGLILGLAFAIILGVVLIIIGIICCWKYVTKRMNESSENRQEPLCIYENVKKEQPKEESFYMGLQSTTEDIYTEMKP
ncbi:pregnancy-specific beta-1-glycoprotein 5-like [Bufo bufo]|uniref:pregnancy-specific beta-1-glycoprotein 5-like n=1 Tax=Bufo bufo TaxID=8384 RepID=UPI001ABE6B06|nr:pregnancy-specific beta-1-glycoprotein 5-like [Bufo bufo]